MRADLTQIDKRPISSTPGSHSAFLVVRNEALRLPYCLDYHRALGIDRFFIVDNGSEDETRAFLLAQPDCHVFNASGSFAEANYGMAWINSLVQQHGIGSWCLFVDADELFVYPNSEKIPLPAFCRYLDRRQSEGVFSLLLDMYSAGPVAHAEYHAGTSFLATAPHFDRHYRFERRFSLSPNREKLFDSEAIGGPRVRAFYPEYQNASQWRKAYWRAFRKLRRHPMGAKLGLARLSVGYGIAPDQTKIPLIRARPGLSWVSNHRCTDLRLSEITGALLHFKFFADFHRRAKIEAARAQHWDGGAEYARYAALVEREPDVSLLFSGSATFESTRQLVDLGLMKSSAELESLAGCRADLRREKRLCDHDAGTHPRRSD